MVQEMTIPKEILDIKRPPNTVVIAYGKDKNLFAVRQRVGCKNVGGRHIPVNGPTIGHIVSLPQPMPVPNSSGFILKSSSKVLDGTTYYLTPPQTNLRGGWLGKATGRRVDIFFDVC
jgi:hypothetical protein